MSPSSAEADASGSTAPAGDAGAGRTVFVTGGTGFVGRAVVPRLERGGWSVVALARRPPADPGTTRWVAGDLLDDAGYAEALAGCDTVVHLAALTGQAARDEYFRVNREGTERLLGAAKEAGVRRFLHVSTIAASYPKLDAYPYAQSKLESEERVRASGLGALVVRPTIVLGRDAPAWAALASLAKAPVMPVFGSGEVTIQPIDVDDLADLVVALAAGDTWDGSCVDLGGPEALTMEQMLRRMRARLRGSEARVLHVPVRPLVGALSLWERMPLPSLPAGAGQFYVFMHPSPARPHPLTEPHRDRMLDVDAMLARYLDDDA